MTIEQVRSLFKRASDYIRIISIEKDIEFNEENMTNQELVDNLKELVKELKIVYPVQAKILQLRYFELYPSFKVSQIMNYSRTLIYYKEVDALKMIADRLSKTNYTSSFEDRGLGL